MDQVVGPANGRTTGRRVVEERTADVAFARKGKGEEARTNANAGEGAHTQSQSKNASEIANADKATHTAAIIVIVVATYVAGQIVSVWVGQSTGAGATHGQP